MLIQTDRSEGVVLGLASRKDKGPSIGNKVAPYGLTSPTSSRGSDAARNVVANAKGSESLVSDAARLADQSSPDRSIAERCAFCLRQVRYKQDNVIVGQLLTGKETMHLLRLKSSHFSKLVNGKLKNVPRLKAIRIGRRLMFDPETVKQWAKKVEEGGWNQIT